MQTNTIHLPLPSFPAIVKIDATRTPTTNRPLSAKPGKRDAALASVQEQLRLGMLKHRDEKLRDLCEDILDADCGDVINGKARRLLAALNRA